VIERSVAASDGRTLAVREAGDPAGIPVFMLHGTPGSNLIYEPYARDADERGIRLISYDRPGFGGSTRHEGRTIAASALDLAQIADSLGIERFCVWGASGGGPPALAAAALLPDRIAAAASIASPAPYGAEGLDYFDGMGELNAEGTRVLIGGGEAPFRAMLEEGRTMIMAGSPEQSLEYLRSLLSDADREALTLEAIEFQIAMSRAGVEGGIDGWYDDDAAMTVLPWGFELSSIRIPVLYWHGRQDRFVPFGHGAWLAARIPGVTAWLTEDDGHITIAERGIPKVHAWLLERY
jgi:pimeloyl-ACP methyl ester carboxylesterase